MLFKVCILIDACYSKILTNFHDGWFIAAHAMKPDIHILVQIWTLSKLAKGVSLEVLTLQIILNYVVAQLFKISE